jgi:hypothetical protein
MVGKSRSFVGFSDRIPISSEWDIYMVKLEDSNGDYLGWHNDLEDNLPLPFLTSS